MITYNCVSIGSLVHRAQGYRKLKEDRPMDSRFYIPEPAKYHRAYYVVSENCQAYIKHDDSTDFLEEGTIVVSLNPVLYPSRDVEVKVIDVKKSNPYEGILYQCSLDKLIKIEETVCHLLAPIKSASDKVKIAKNPDLCEQLSRIDVGQIVTVADYWLGTVTSKIPVGNGVGVHFQVKIFRCSEYEHTNKYKIGENVWLTAEKLRLMDSKFFNQNSTHLLEDVVDFTAYTNPSNQFKNGDKVVWLNESEPSRSGIICWNSRINESSRLHLKGDCKMVHCDRIDTVNVPTKELMLETEYSRRLGENKKRDWKSSISYDKINHDSEFLNEARVADLIELSDDFTKNFANLSSKSSSKFYAEFSKDDFLRNSESNNLTEVDDSDLGIGSVVEIKIKSEPHYGVIKWIGKPKFQGCETKSLTAGIELEEEHYAAGYGILQGHKYFDCAPHRGIFRLLEHCKKDSRFSDSSHSIVNDIRALSCSARMVIPGIVEPVNDIDFERMFEKYHGIQGHNNSCYLDATLFSMFTFTSVFDSLLLRPANDTDCDCYNEVQRVLREEIVNPLRKNLFVHADSVMNLRTLLDNSTSVTGLTCEEKDPEEFLTSLIAQVLKAEPFLKLSSGHEAYYYQLFVEKDEHLRLPNVQQLFEQSLISSDIKLKEVPSCLIIQMPRFGKSYKMYPRILPSQLLDVTNVIENSPKECSACGELAQFECKECFKRYYNESQWNYFCESCVKTIHNHEERRHHKPNILQVPRECVTFRDPGTVPRQYMELFAVLCIETSHYVAFVKCGSGPDTPWCFFDSMADRKGELNGFNIPEMVLCPELPLWLSDNGFQEFAEIKDDRNLPPYAKRLLCDAYMCMYQSPDVMMYR